MEGSILDIFVKAYVGVALWSSTDDKGNFLSMNYDYGLESFSEREQTFMKQECKAFLLKAMNMIKPHQLEQAGHDFWLTRNGHGTGFWDRKEVWGTHSLELSQIAVSFGTREIMEAEDFKLTYY
jgi:hypothetical protein